jgi:hypothetical protein
LRDVLVALLHLPVVLCEGVRRAVVPEEAGGLLPGLRLLRRV